jgi:hypothetical protein
MVKFEKYPRNLRKLENTIEFRKIRKIPEITSQKGRSAPQSPDKLRGIFQIFPNIIDIAVSNYPEVSTKKIY